MLEYLVRHQGRVMSRTLITEYAWDYHFDPGTNIVDVVDQPAAQEAGAGPGLEDPAHRARRGLRREGGMSTLRQKLTLWYTAAVLATLTAFGATLYIDRRVSTARELDQRLALEANLSGYWLAESQRVLGRLVTYEDGVPKLDPGITAYFDAFRDYLIVAAPDGRPLYVSDTARTLPFASLEQMLDPLRTSPGERRYGTYSPDPSVGSAPLRGAAGGRNGGPGGRPAGRGLVQLRRVRPLARCSGRCW